MDLSQPNLRKITLLREQIENWDQYPFSIQVILTLKELEIKSRIVFLIGENGSGKSTILEAIAQNFGMGKEGGSKNLNFQTSEAASSTTLSEKIRLSWTPKLLNGYFFRAESFFNLATQLDTMSKDLAGEKTFLAYGGKSLHQQSHGQSFLALFQNRLSSNGFYLLDEPEAALSPQRQLSMLVVLRNILTDFPNSQFIIATHSPILLSFPGAQIFSFDGEKISETNYKDTEIYKITSDFLRSPDQYIKLLFADQE